MSEKKLYLHIGYPKSGTTAIQDNLALNREIMRQQDILYPMSAMHVNAHHYLPWALSADPRAQGHSPEGIIADLQQELVAGESTSMLISSEAFVFSCSPEQARNALSGLNMEITIIVYIRAPLAWIRSDYNQGVKGRRGLTETFDEFVSDSVNRRQGPLNFYDRIERWARVFGWGNIVIRDYQPTNDVVSCFLEALNIEKGKLQWLPPSRKDSNPALPLSCVEYARLMNMAGVEFRQKSKALAMLRELHQSDPHNERPYLSKKNFEKLEKILEENRRKFRKALSPEAYHRIEAVFASEVYQASDGRRQVDLSNALEFSRDFSLLAEKLVATTPGGPNA